MKSSIARHRHMSICLILAASATLGLTEARGDSASVGSTASLGTGLTYVDMVDLADRTPLVVQVRVNRVTPLSPEQAVGVPAGFRRLYIEAQVIALIRGDAGVSPIVTYLFDAPVDSRGKVAKLKKAEKILFARPGSRPGQLQLVARDAQIDSTPDTVARTKSVLSDLLSNSAPPRITGVGDAFHVAGTVAGEGETQIFLRTENGEPVSLSVLRRPGEAPRWAVALGEIVDEAARMPVRGGLLWYRLACSLPAALPPRATRTLAVQEAEAARADYQVVVDALGRCDRTRTPA